MKVSDLSFNELSALMAFYSRKLAKIPPKEEATPAQTRLWETLMAKKTECILEFERKEKEVEFTNLPHTIGQ